MAYLYHLLGEFRFQRPISRQPGGVYAYEYVHSADAKKKIVAVWSPTGSDRKGMAEVAIGSAKVVRAERMSLAPGDATTVDVTIRAGNVSLAIEEAPLFVVLQE